MADSGFTYSRLVAFLIVILPLCALGLLSTLFLISRDFGGDLSNSIPFAERELEKRARDQQITAPFFSGKTTGGHLVSFTAKTARPDPNDPAKSSAKEMAARIDLTDGSQLRFSSDLAQVNNHDHTVTLSGKVLIQSSNGYSVQTEELTSAMRELKAESPGLVAGNGPIGRFEAGKMEILPSGSSDEATLLFTNGVKLIYTPKN